MNKDHWYILKENCIFVNFKLLLNSYNARMIIYFPVILEF